MTHGGLAQVVEQPVHTRYVPGSSPGTATSHGSYLPPPQRVAAIARLRRAVATAVDRRDVISPGETVIVACSGGPDSSALLDALSRLAPPRGWRLIVVHIDHGLRAESGAEAAVVAELAAERHLTFRSIAVSVTAGASLQDRARQARAAALRSAAASAGATAIALGHTADDQAETVLMRLLSSATPRSLLAMGERDGALRRPLLRVWRQETQTYCTALGMAPVEDPSNSDRRFLRTRVRHDLLPALEAAFPAARRRLVTLAERQRQLLQQRGAVPDP